MIDEDVRLKLSELGKRAQEIKADPNLRHVPNENDLRIMSEHVTLMAYPQYQTTTSSMRYNINK